MTQHATVPGPDGRTRAQDDHTRTRRTMAAGPADARGRDRCVTRQPDRGGRSPGGADE